MNVRNCRRCRKLFNYVIGPYLCPQCREDMEQKFQEVKKFVREHAHADVRTVSEECDVDTTQIRQWVKEERLIFSDDSAIGIACERCGTTIRSGRFCEKCKIEMTNGFKNAITPAREQTTKKREDLHNNPKMRYLDNGGEL